MFNKMSILIFFTYILFLFACNNFQNSKKNDNYNNSTYLNLDFELSSYSGNLRYWYIGGEGYEISIDSSIFYSGKKSLRITKTSYGKLGVATSTFPIEDVKGKHITYTGYIKTNKISSGYAGLWWRVDGNEGVIKLENMHNYGPSGTTPWTQYKIEMNVDKNVTNINFGVLLSGNGTAWFDSLNILIEGELYKQTIPKPFVINDEQLTWLKEKVIPISTEEPVADMSDLTPLKSSFEKAEIIALGEGTHGTSEFFKMKHRLVRYITEQNKNAVFAIEANMPETRRVNKYIQTGIGDPKDALTGMYFWTWNTQEVLDMIEWMKDYNISGKGEIEFWGFDMQNPKVAADNVREFVKKNDTAYLDSVTVLYDIVIASYEKMRERYQMRSSLAEEWYKAALRVFNHLKNKRSYYLETEDDKTIELIIQNSRIIVQGAQNYIRGSQSRDESMSENVIWIKNHIAKDKKLILWAHNGHVSKMEGRMGNYLYHKYGDDMFVLGFSFYAGDYTAVGNNGLGIYSTSLPEQGSIEWILHQTGIQKLIINFRNIDNSKTHWLNNKIDFRSIGARALDYAFYQTVITSEFDALIFFDETTPSQLLVK